MSRIIYGFNQEILSANYKNIFFSVLHCNLNPKRRAVCQFVVVLSDQYKLVNFVKLINDMKPKVCIMTCRKNGSFTQFVTFCPKN
ncbi:hypothetical protein PHJA_001433200, partial [Phtheirospermum japonicum]